MRKQNGLVLKNLLEFEYFPSELPPCFSTSSLALKCKNIENFDDASMNKMTSLPIKFSSYKSRNNRRILSIPHPYYYLKMVKALVDNQTDLFKIFEKSNSSLTKPLNKKCEANLSVPYMKTAMVFNDTKNHIEKIYAGNKYEIKLDINNFFGSIYTHTISWVLHGKKNAKKNSQNSTLLGNILDKCCTSVNDRQTSGILVGNAASRIISEIILCFIDEKLEKQFEKKQIVYRRYVDDYYIFVKEASQIEYVISEIRILLQEYELNLNDNKVQIIEAPFVETKKWIINLKKSMIFNINDLYDTIILEYINNNRDIKVLRYGLKLLDCRIIEKHEWEKIESKIYNLMVNCPEILPDLLNIFIYNKDYLNKKELKRSLYEIINFGLKIKKDLEVVWAIYYIKLLEIKPSHKIIKNILDSDNVLAIIIAADLYKEHLMPSKLIENIKSAIYFSNSSPEQRNEILFSKWWIVAYELRIHKFFNSANEAITYPDHNPFFKLLKKHNISFYDTDCSKVLESKKEKNSSNSISDLRKIIKEIASNTSNFDNDANQYLLNKLSDVVDLVVKNEY